MSTHRHLVLVALTTTLVAPAASAHAAAGPVAVERGGAVQLLRAGAAPRPLAGPGSAEPAISPDGRRVAYAFRRDIWVRDLDGTDPRRVTTDAGDDAAPAWSPDGTQLVLSTRRDARTVELAVVAATGGALRLLTHTPGTDERDPAWSPDGRQIAYERTGCERPGDGGSCVFVMAPDGGAQTNLTPEASVPGCEASPGFAFAGQSSAPAWAPDSASLAFTGPTSCGVTTTGTDIWTMTRTGSGKTDLTHDDATNDDAPTFAPDGTAVLFRHVTADDSRGGLAVLPRAGGALVPVTADPTDARPDWGPAPRPSCVVPRLAGRTVAAARGLLRAAGCRLGAVGRRRSSAARVARVVGQTPARGRDELLGTRVAVTVGAAARRR